MNEKNVLFPCSVMSRDSCSGEPSLQASADSFRLQAGKCLITGIGFLILSGASLFAYPAPPAWLSPSGNTPVMESPDRVKSDIGKFDRNNDGIPDFIVMDRNSDSRSDYWATDRNFDGYIDDYQYDRNFDAKIDQWEYDHDHDGVPEKIFIDGDGDGVSELVGSLHSGTRTYNWQGDLKEVSASADASLTAEKGITLPLKPKRKLAKGKAAFSE
ncbi:MAG: hypothetical protein HQM10_17050 [Candidatus Riflebacteria bacterium]|nr:hypothetical protein [Candidatus Riflebacteria bacterium]